MLTGRDHEEQEQEEPLNKIPRLRQEKFSVLTPWLVWLGMLGIFFFDSMSGSLISKAVGLRIGSVCKFSLHPEECSTKYRMGQNRKKILRKILAAEITKTIIALYLYIYCSCRITKYRY